MAENKRSFRKQKAAWLQLRGDTKNDVQNQIPGMPSSDFNSDSFFVLLLWLEWEYSSNSDGIVCLVDERTKKKCKETLLNFIDRVNFRAIRPEIQGREITIHRSALGDEVINTLE